MRANLKAWPVISSSSYLPMIILFVGTLILGKNIEGTRLNMVFLISVLMIVQSVSILILTSVFLCIPGENGNGYRTPPYGADKNLYFPGYDFWYAACLQLANAQSYVSLVWLYTWWQAFQDSKLKDDLQTCIAEDEKAS